MRRNEAMPAGARLRRVLGAAALAAVLATGAGAGHDYEEPVDFITADQAKRLLDAGEDVTFVDLRSAGEFGRGHLPGARSIPVEALGQRWKEIPTSGRVVLYCTCRPGQNEETYAFTLMRQERYRNVRVLEAGYAGWVARGYPVEPVTR